MESGRSVRSGRALRASPLGVMPLRQFWRLVNRAQQVDGAVVRVACLLLLITYVVSVVARREGQPALLAIRAVMLAYTAVGIVFGPRFSWSAVRAYAVGMALLLPSTTAALEVLRGNHPSDLVLTALAIFASVIFLQTAVDVLAVFALLALGTATLLMTVGPPGVPLAVAAVVLTGALAAGAATAVVLIAFRARVSESTTWWQEACARERALREFVELAAPHLGAEVLAREFAERLRSAFGGGHCTLVLLDPASGTPHIAATAGARPSTIARAPASAEALAELLGRAASRQPLVCERLTADDVERRFAGLPWLAVGGTLVVLPIAGDEAAAGAIVLSATGPRSIGEEELLLWRAMANQVGVAIGSARLFTRLQEALRVRSEFVSMMSHELRSPLHVILGYADMLAERRQEPAVVAERVRASALELLQLVENTLAAARLGSGKVRLQLSEFALAQLVAELRESASALPEAGRGVRVRWEMSDDLPPVRLDRLKVKEVVHNLVSNALKFTEQGEVAVRIAREGERLRIDVEDTGSGIPPEAQARLFEMFERLETKHGPRAPGAGLGLYIVKSLVQLMGGTVTLTSVPGRGSRFTVLLPIGREG